MEKFQGLCARADVRGLLARRKGSNMTLSTIHRANKRRSFSFLVMTTVSLLMPIATLGWLLNPIAAYGASLQHKGTTGVPLIDGTPGINPTITQVNTLPTFTNTSQQTISGITLAVFYKRPDGFMPSGTACSNPVLSFTPSNSVKDPTQSCPWFTCNYVSWSPQGQGECSTVGVSDQQLKQATNAASLPKTTAWSQFKPVSSSGTGTDTYMMLKFPDASLTPGDKFVLNGCIYYDNWPRFSDQQAIDALAVYSGDNTLLRVWGTLPQGMDPQTLAKDSLKGDSTGGTGASTGWTLPSNLQ